MSLHPTSAVFVSESAIETFKAISSGDTSPERAEQLRALLEEARKVDGRGLPTLHHKSSAFLLDGLERGCDVRRLAAALAALAALGEEGGPPARGYSHERGDVASAARGVDATIYGWRSAEASNW